MKQYFSKKVAMAMVIVIPQLFFTQCSEDFMLDSTSDVTSSVNTLVTQSQTSDCSTCTYVVPPKTHVIDGNVLGLKPGSVIGLSSSVTYNNLVFRNINGTADNPIVIRNCNGTAVLNGTGLSFTLKTESSKFFQITGGNISKVYGIKIIGGSLGITLDKMSTNFEVDHIEIQDVRFAGIMAKTDPSCDDATNRDHFIMKNVYFHNNYIHETGGEAMYIGNSFYADGRTFSCGVRYPHEIHYLKINNNIIKNAGWDGIQVGCATKGARIYANTIENYGTQNEYNQRSGLQIGEGTGGICYGNLIKTGSGNGMTVLGLGDNYIYNNIIDNAGAAGIFCDERYTPGPGFKFINNTILNPKGDGIRIYAEKLPMNVIVNNIIANPGTYSLYSYPRAPEEAFVYKLSKYMKIEMSNNHFTTTNGASFGIDIPLLNYKLATNSPVIDMGKDISSYNIQTDYYKKARLKGAAYDIGAVEY
jgi:hypothetical protein